MRKLTIKEAARMLQQSEQATRMMIQFERIPGAFCYGPKHRRTYFVTDEQIRRMMEGRTND